MGKVSANVSISGLVPSRMPDMYSSQGRGGNLLVLFYEYMHCGQFEAERVRAAKFEALWYVKRESYVHLNHSDFPTHDFLVALSSSTIIG